MEFVSEDNKCSEKLWMDKDDMQHKKVQQTKNNELGNITGQDDEVTLTHDKQLGMVFIHVKSNRNIDQKYLTSKGRHLYMI